MKSYNITHIVEEIVGPIQPIGDSHGDRIRHENLTETCGLVDDLILEIRRVAGYKDSHEASVKKAGSYAHQFLTDLRESIAE